jgi:hypothetical protein
MHIRSRLVLLLALATSSVVGVCTLSAQTTLVSSLSNTTITVLEASPTARWANAFTTGATSALLNSVTFKYQSNQSTDTTISAFVYSSAGSVPGSLLATATSAVLGNNNGSFYEAQISLNFAGGFTLSANTDYFIVSGASLSVFGVAGTNSSQTGLSGFSIYSSSTFSTNGGASFGGSSNGALFALSGSAIPEPSTYAAILGLVAVGAAAWRRRRNLSAT